MSPGMPHPFVCLVISQMVLASISFETVYAVLTGKFIESRSGNCYDRVEEKTWKEQMP